MKNLQLSLLAAAAMSLAGCAALSPGNSNTRAEPTHEEAAGSKFVARNHEAVNRLVAGMVVANHAETPVLIATVVNVNDLRRTAPLGRTLSEQYASRMVANGFNVKEIKLRSDVFVREETGELMLSREIKDIAKMHNASLVLVGTYSAAAQFAYVSLKLVRTDSGQIVRGHDYALPRDADVNALLQLAK